MMLNRLDSSELNNLKRLNVSIEPFNVQFVSHHKRLNPCNLFINESASRTKSNVSFHCSSCFFFLFFSSQQQEIYEARNVA